jgi:hypothetical protein
VQLAEEVQMMKTAIKIGTLAVVALLSVAACHDQTRRETTTTTTTYSHEPERERVIVVPDSPSPDSPPRVIEHRSTTTVEPE